MARRAVLICFHGQFRGDEASWRTVRAHLVGPNRADTALLVERDERIPAYAVFDMVWRIASIGRESWRAVPNGDTVARLLRASAKVFSGYAYGAPHMSGSGTFLWTSFFEIYRRARALRYDVYVVTRTDFRYLCPYTVDALCPRGPCAPRVEGYGGINDRHLVIPREDLGMLRVMEAIAARCSLAAGLWCFRCHTEAMLGRLWRRRVVGSNSTMYLVPSRRTRSWAGSGRRSATCKYPAEYRAARAACGADAPRDAGCEAQLTADPSSPSASAPRRALGGGVLSPTAARRGGAAYASSSTKASSAGR